MKGTHIFFLLLFLSISISSHGKEEESIAQLRQKIGANSKHEKIQALQDLCWSYKNINLDSSTYFIEEAIKLSTESGSKEDLIESLMLKGVVAKNKGNYDEAMNIYLQALDICKKTKTSYATSNIFFNISNLYFQLKDLPNAISNYRKGLDLLADEDPSPESLAEHYLAMSNLYENAGKTDSADFFIRKTLENINEIQDPTILASIYNNLGFSFQEKLEFDSAINYYKKGLALYRAENNLKWEGQTLIMLGILYAQDLGQNKIALESYLFPALKLFQQIQNRNHIMEAYDRISLAYENLSCDTAYDYYYKYVTLKDSLFEEDRLKRIEELNALYQFEKIRATKEQVARQRNGFLALSIFLVLLAFAFALQYQRTRVRRILESQKNKEQKTELLDQLKNQEIESINAMMEIQGKERDRIAVDLHDRVGSLLATVKINYEALKKQVDQLGPEISEKYTKANQILDQACKDVRAISHDMNSGILAQFGLIPAITEIKESIERSGKMSIHLDTFGIDDRLDNKTEIFLYRIIQEMLTNIIKHAEATEVDIQLSRVGEEISLIIEDNGKGFDPSTIADREGKGMGINNLKMRVNQLGGEFTIDSSPGRGTSVIVDVPLTPEKSNA